MNVAQGTIGKFHYCSPTSDSLTENKVLFKGPCNEPEQDISRWLEDCCDVHEASNQGRAFQWAKGGASPTIVL
ncbi:unnamed protein product [Cyprideis torosa]|uniref:Uncharacterized protein n=1 Tax=Cyprideis torosa TaxID=163714 RepID=A0A7R8WG20_9CRUS|nr:unnamed protein product [Cyprideis torosa]CAG0897697.1 unnamed protein product [Cyprideis torosa]